MKLKWIMFWLDCPQIRWEYGDYEYSFWLWMRRRGEWPNTIGYFNRMITDGAYEERGYVPHEDRQQTKVIWKKL